MILGFKENFPWKEPTNFREKILAGAKQPYDFDNPQFKQLLKVHTDIRQWTPKINTMRVDQFDRWKPGMSIQMVYRGPNYSIKDHFNKGITELERCVSTQKIKIEWYTFHVKPLEILGVGGGLSRHPKVTIDGVVFASACTQIRQLAANDGFDSLDDFYRWFNKDWSGKIIHWTDFRY